MQKKTLKIKIVPSEQNASSMDKSLYSNYSRINEPTQQFTQLVEMFKIFVKTANSRTTIDPNNCCDLEPRDRSIIVPRFKTDLMAEQELSMNEWLTSVFKTVHSSAFNFFSKNQMSFEHTKIFCAENVLKNLVCFAKQKKIGSSELLALNKFLKKKILKYLKCKYPITESKLDHKKFSDNVSQINKLEAPTNNYVKILGIPFTLIEDGNYRDLIMRMMNSLMKTVDSVLDSNPDKTLFQDFQESMNQIFDRAYDSNKAPLVQSLQNHKLSNSLVEMSPLINSQIIYEKEKSTLEGKQSKGKVKEYTQSAIGRKIPQNVPLYSQKQIQSKNMTIKHPSILRILVKWCEQLWKKFQEPNYYSNRAENINTQTGDHLNTLVSWMRKDIDNKLAIQKQYIQQYKAHLKQTNYQMQAKILEQELGIQGNQYIQEAEKISGKFACKIVKNMQSATIAYLNRLIHGILKVSKEFYSQHSLSKDLCWPSPPNLISFRMGDIMRCKCQSKQKEIIQIYNQIKRLDREDPQRIRILRIKNRLKSGTNDILINIKFRKTLLCQIQLAINTKSSSFIKCSNSFNHYLYQLQRSELGPLTELCNIWTNLDSRTSIYESLIEQQEQKCKQKEHLCSLHGKHQQFRKYEQPFICSKCLEAYYHTNYLIDHVKCQNCDYYVCARCNVEKKNIDELKRSIKDKRICEVAIRKLNKGQPLPTNGVCVLIQSKRPKVQCFKHVKDKQLRKQQIFGLEPNNKIYEIQQISTKKQLQDFWRKHIVFQIKEKYALNLKLEDIQYYNLKLKVKSSLMQEKQIISLMNERLGTQKCRQIINMGTKQQKSHTKCLFLIDNSLDCLPINPKEFTNLKWLTLSRNKIHNFKGIDLLEQLKILYCKAGQLSQIPPEVYRCYKLTKLNLFHNSISQIGHQISNLKHLQLLDLQRNRIQKISEEIKQCRMLTQLSLSYNKIETLPKGLFTLSKLSILTLQNNKLKFIPEEIVNLHQLKELYLSQNPDLAYLHPNITNHSQLEVLFCGQTSLHQLPHSFKQFKKLKQLTLHKTKIQQLPDYFQQLNQLQILDISGFTNIENCIYLTNLKELKLRLCTLKQLPRWLAQLKKLQILDISDNELTSIGSDILNDLTELVSLQAKNNKITRHPDIRPLDKLVRLNLENNKIAYIDFAFLTNQSSLEHYTLTSNCLTSLPFSITSLDKLVELNVNNNKLLTFIEHLEGVDLNPKLAFWPQLRKLNLEHNFLKEIPLYLCRCHKIIELILSSNLLESVPAELKECKNLKLLKIQRNLLTEVPPIIREMPNFEEIYLKENKIAEIPSWAQHYLKRQNCEANGMDYILLLIDYLLVPKSRRSMPTESADD